MGAFLSRPFCIAAGLLYPAYASFKALESPQHDDDKQWLTYWVVYALSTSMETATEKIMSWFPGYYAIKIMLLIWLMLPYTRGAVILYENFIFPLLNKYEPILDAKIIAMRDALSLYIRVTKARAANILKEGIDSFKDGSLSKKLEQIVTKNTSKRSFLSGSSATPENEPGI